MCAEMMDITRDESKRILRRLELEAYSSIISAFRAQGELSRAKKKILQELGAQLSISTERHRAEVRRAYSDDRLAIVAESIYGAGSCAEWAAEGRRLVPLMPRLVPQTVFSASATAAANSATAANAKTPASSVNKAGSSSSSLNATTNSSSSSSPQNSSKAATVKQQTQTGTAQGSEADGFDDDGKPKRKRRLSVSSLNKPVTKVTIPTPTLVSKAPTKQTTSVSTMTKSGKALGPAGTVKPVPRMSPLPASSSQVKLLTKTVAVSQAICQAKTVLNYKTMTTVASSPAKTQTAMTQSIPKNQSKVASVSAPKAVLASKTPLSTVGKGVSTGAAANPAATANPIGVALKTSLTAAQLASKQKAKPAAARFKPLPGTVKFKSVTPATMGTCSTVTMVTPSPSSQASSTLPATSTQPVVRVIHVPGTGGVGVSKPVVVMTTGLTKTTVAGVVPGVSSAASLTKTTSQLTQNPSSNKTVASTSTTSSSLLKPKVSSAVTQAAPSASKTVVMTTLVGGTKRVVLSVPAPLQPAPTVSAPTTSSQGIVITKTQGSSNIGTTLHGGDGGGKAIFPPFEVSKTSKSPVLGKVSQLILSPITGVGLTTLAVTQSTSKKDNKIAPVLTTVNIKPCPTQITPSLSAPTVTTQVRSRPLPAILPAPPKPSSMTQAPPSVTAASSIRKLPTILPAPAKNVTVIPTVLVPMATGVGAHAGAQLQSSVPLAVSTTISGVGMPGLNDVASQQYPSTSESGLISADQSNHSSVMNENSELSKVSSSKMPVINEPSCVPEGDNNTSSEDDSLLMCSETIDNSCSITEAPSAVDFFTSVAESTPVKDLAENNAVDLSQTSLDSTEEHEATHKTGLGPLSLQDIEVSVSDLDTENGVQKDLFIEADSCENHTEAFAESIENVTVQRLDVSGEISDIAVGGLSEEIYAESDVADLEEEKDHRQEEDSDQSLSLGETHCHDKTVSVKDAEDGLPVENPGLPVQNALQIIESFVESMEASSGGQVDDSQLPSHNFSLGFAQSSSLQNSSLPEVPGNTSEKGNEICEQLTAVADTVKSLGEGQNSNLLTKFEDENWDSSDPPIDVLSTSTSSSNSASESIELTEKEIKALEAFGSIRTSGRKRKPPTSLDVSPPRQVSGWVRGALSLLQKVASYRGQGRRKGDFGAASWFLKPVDPVDAPGYYKVIKNPMDFGTIRVKLETGKYQEYSEFHADMMLVKTNCLKYNPPGHDVRQDCEEVFRFYETEYGKMLERWEKCHVSPAKKPRLTTKSETST